MTKKRRTVITEESHEVWIIRHGDDEPQETDGPDETVETSSSELVPLNLDDVDSDLSPIDSNTVDSTTS
jgi:hypothetical protein